jgi:hypothetical protein
VIRGPGPDHEAVAQVLEARLNLWLLEPQEVLINDELLEVGSQKLVLLLGIAFDTVSRIKLLDLLLFGV